jgi:hypothetical protein
LRGLRRLGNLSRYQNLDGNGHCTFLDG